MTGSFVLILALLLVRRRLEFWLQGWSNNWEDIYINYMFANQLGLQRFTARYLEVLEAISGLLALIIENSGTAVGPRRMENSKHSRELQARQFSFHSQKKILEQIIKQGLCKHPNGNQAARNSQHGFVKNKPCQVQQMFFLKQAGLTERTGSAVGYISVHWANIIHYFHYLTWGDTKFVDYFYLGQSHEQIGDNEHVNTTS